MSARATLLRTTRVTLSLACVLMAGGPSALAADESAAPSSAEASSAPTASSPITMMPSYAPLPEQVASIPADIPTVSVAPESEASLAIGMPIAYTLGHCGLWSPIDIDGSLWQPIGGHDVAGDVIASDEAIGELINATAGLLELRSPQLAEFRSVSGVVVVLQRAPGELDYPLCM